MIVALAQLYIQSNFGLADTKELQTHLYNIYSHSMEEHYVIIEFWPLINSSCRSCCYRNLEPPPGELYQWQSGRITLSCNYETRWLGLNAVTHNMAFVALSVTAMTCPVLQKQLFKLFILRTGWSHWNCVAQLTMQRHLLQVISDRKPQEFYV